MQRQRHVNALVKANLDISVGIFQLLLQVVHFKLQSFVHVAHFAQQLCQTLYNVQITFVLPQTGNMKTTNGWYN